MVGGWLIRVVSCGVIGSVWVFLAVAASRIVVATMLSGVGVLLVAQVAVVGAVVDSTLSLGGRGGVSFIVVADALGKIDLVA